MLGMLSGVSLLAGTFVAGGGLFDWNFMFSNGFRERDWVRSMGRDGARGLMMLLGSVLIIVGFVGEVVDAAAKPIALAVSTQETPDTIEETSPRGGSSSGSMDTARPAPSRGPTAAKPPLFQRPSAASPASHSAAASTPPPPPPAAGGQQPITIWNPQLELQDGQMTVRIQYRFESGHEPLPGAQYVWRIEAPSKLTEVVYDSLGKDGQLEYLLNLPEPEKHLNETWLTFLKVESAGKQAQVSNQLEVAGGKVRSVPLESSR